MHSSDHAGLPATGYPGGTWQPGIPRYAAGAPRAARLAMDDGVELDAAIVMPVDPATGLPAAGRFPVVVEFTPYVQLGVPVTPIPWFAEHGYISAVVWTRGTGRSQGQVDMYGLRDAQDGKAIVNWAARLPGSDGRVAMAGCSFPAAQALCTAAAVGPHSPLKAIVVACNGLEGVVRQSWLVGGLLTGGFRYLRNAPAMQGDTPAARRFYAAMMEDIERGGDCAYERAFWRERLPLQTAQQIVENGVAVLLWTGWRDILAAPALRCCTALHNAARGQPVAQPLAAGAAPSPRWQIVLGDWVHTEGLDLGVWLQWLETWVRGADTGLQRAATPMHLYECGTRRWVNVSAWPPVERHTRWHLAAEGLLAAEPPPAGTASLAWGPPSAPGCSLGFTSAPLPEGATLAGPVAACLHASSSNTNLILIAKLYDLAPDGGLALVCKGAVLGSQARLDEARTWRDDGGTATWPYPALERDEDLRPGEIRCFEIALGPVQWGVRPGHRLRLELTTQNPPEVCADRALNCDPCGLTAPQQATVPGGVYTLRFGGDRPATLSLPLLAAQCFPAAAEGPMPTAWSDWKRTLRPSALTMPLAW